MDNLNNWFNLKPNIYKHNINLNRWLKNKIQYLAYIFFKKLKNYSDEELSKPLTFIANKKASTIKLTKEGNPNISELKYRTTTDGQWNDYTIDTLIDLGTNGIVQFKNTENTLSTSDNDYVKFVMTGSISASGNMQSMLNYSPSCSNYCYYKLFFGCHSLKTSPILSALILANDCYAYMFYSCTSLTTIQTMLPAKQLSNECYLSMFQNCTNLIASPYLPANLLTYKCYFEMFKGCHNLHYIKVNFEHWYNENNNQNSNENTNINGLSLATYNWLKDVHDFGIFIKSNQLLQLRGTSNIPENWNIQSLNPISSSSESSISSISSQSSESSESSESSIELLDTPLL